VDLKKIRTQKGDATVRTTNQTVPYGTDSCLDAFPGNKLPGYLHLVPPGQLTGSPAHIFDSRPGKLFRVLIPNHFLPNDLPLI
jgi:hypothetical protein